MAKSHIIKSRPISKPSISAPADGLPVANRTMGSIRNSCFVGTPPSAWEVQENKVNKHSKENQDLPFLSLSINNSCRFNQNTDIDKFEEDRRKSESTYVRCSNNPSFLKGNGDAVGNTTRLKEPNTNHTN
jgi:hypothetical protein